MRNSSTSALDAGPSTEIVGLLIYAYLTITLIPMLRSLGYFALALILGIDAAWVAIRRSFILMSAYLSGVVATLAYRLGIGRASKQLRTLGSTAPKTISLEQL